LNQQEELQNSKLSNFVAFRRKDPRDAGYI